MRTMVEVRNKERQDAARLCELELQASERAQAIERAESNLRLKDFEYERRVTELQKDHAHKVQDLLSQLAVAQQEQDNAVEPGQAPGSAGEGTPPRATGGAGAAGKGAESPSPRPGASPGASSQTLKGLVATQQEQIRTLDKDNYYYKNTNRELKRKLRELLARVDTDKEVVGQEIEETQGRNRDLEKLNESLVEELDNVRSHLRQSGAGIRLSRSELRPLTAEQVQGMKVRASVSRGGGQ